MVTFIQSLFNEFGTRVVVPGTGIVLNDRLAKQPARVGESRGPSRFRRPLHTLVGYQVAHRGRRLVGSTPGRARPSADQLPGAASHHRRRRLPAGCCRQPPLAVGSAPAARRRRPVVPGAGIPGRLGRGAGSARPPRWPPTARPPLPTCSGAAPSLGDAPSQRRRSAQPTTGAEPLWPSSTLPVDTDDPNGKETP